MCCPTRNKKVIISSYSNGGSTICRIHTTVVVFWREKSTTSLSEDRLLRILYIHWSKRGVRRWRRRTTIIRMQMYTSSNPDNSDNYLLKRSSPPPPTTNIPSHCPNTHPTIHTTTTLDASSVPNHHHSVILSHPTIFYILIMETTERFAYYGFRAIVFLYLLQSLQYNETTAIALYGYNSSLSYLTPLLRRCHLGESISHDFVFQRIVPH